MLQRIISIVILACFCLNTLGPWPAQAEELRLPAPGTMVPLSSAFEPMLMKGLKVNPKDPFQFEFIMDTGNDVGADLVSARDGRTTSLPAGRQGSPLRTESAKLIKYFLAALTVSEKDLWVNLSPYEKDRMIPSALGQTEMGRDMLAQDYLLKQLTASLFYPEKDLGREFWNKVYAKAQALYGTTKIPVNTFNKVWIVADRADVFERGNIAYITGAHLKVMMESDYLAMSKNIVGAGPRPAHNNFSQGSWAGLEPAPTDNTIAPQIIRELIIPAIETEINTGKNFAPLRQMFYSMILASWYKMALKDALVAQVYGDQNKVKGLGINDVGAGPRPAQFSPRAGLEPAPTRLDVETIYQQYLTAYKKGVFNYIKEQPTPSTQESAPRKYFSGGLEVFPKGDAAQVIHRTTTLPKDFALASQNTFNVKVDFAMATQPPRDPSERIEEYDLSLEEDSQGLAEYIANPPSREWLSVPKIIGVMTLSGDKVLFAAGYTGGQRSLLRGTKFNNKSEGEVQLDWSRVDWEYDIHGELFSVEIMAPTTLNPFQDASDELLSFKNILRDDLPKKFNEMTPLGKRYREGNQTEVFRIAKLILRSIKTKSEKTADGYYGQVPVRVLIYNVSFETEEFVFRTTEEVDDKAKSLGFEANINSQTPNGKDAAMIHLIQPHQVIKFVGAHFDSEWEEDQFHYTTLPDFVAFSNKWLRGASPHEIFEQLNAPTPLKAAEERTEELNEFKRRLSYFFFGQDKKGAALEEALEGEADDFRRDQLYQQRMIFGFTHAFPLIYREMGRHEGQMKFEDLVERLLGQYKTTNEALEMRVLTRESAAEMLSRAIYTIQKTKQRFGVEISDAAMNTDDPQPVAEEQAVTIVKDMYRQALKNVEEYPKAIIRVVGLTSYSRKSQSRLWLMDQDIGLIGKGVDLFEHLKLKRTHSGLIKGTSYQQGNALKYEFTSIDFRFDKSGLYQIFVLPPSISKPKSDVTDALLAFKGMNREELPYNREDPLHPYEIAAQDEVILTARIIYKALLDEIGEEALNDIPLVVGNKKLGERISMKELASTKTSFESQELSQPLEAPDAAMANPDKPLVEELPDAAMGISEADKAELLESLPNIERDWRRALGEKLKGDPSSHIDEEDIEAATRDIGKRFQLVAEALAYFLNGEVDQLQVGGMPMSEPHLKKIATTAPHYAENTIIRARVRATYLKNQPPEILKEDAFRGKKLIILDDHPREVKRTQDFLTDLGAEVVLYRNFSSVSPSILKDADAILIDWHLGLETARDVIEELQRKRIKLPMIVFTQADTESALRDLGDVPHLRAASKARPATTAVTLRDLLNSMPDEAMKGGIDFDSSKMQMNVRKEGQGLGMKFDQATIAQIKKQGFEGLVFHIQSITPVSDLRYFLGL